MYRKSKKLLAWALVVCMLITNMLFSNLAFAATKSTALPSERLAGADRYATAIEISKAEWTTSQYAVLAYGEGFADALAAAPLAAKYDAPILLTDKAALSAGVLDELKRLGVKNVFIVGGEGVVSKAVADALTAAGMTPERLAGADRYATALAVANKIGTTTEVVVAYGENYPDALGISAIAAAKGMPILLTDKDAMNADVKAYIGTKKAYVVGGEGVVSAAVFNGLTGAVRLSGADRYATNLAVLQQFAAGLNWANVFMATGEGYADALAGAALAARYGSPVVLAAGSLDAATASFLAGKVNSATGVIAFGGAAVVSDAVVASVKPSAPSAVGVDSITTMGLSGIKVVFNKEVDKDSAIKVSNYQFDGVSLSDGTDVASLASDNKTLYIMLNTAVTQYKKTLFTIKDKVVLSKDTLTSIPKSETTLTFSDTEQPSVSSVSVSGNKKVTVMFSEPVKLGALASYASYFKIDGQYLSSYGFTNATASTATVGNNVGMKVNLNFDVALPAGAHTLKTLKGSTTSHTLEDAAGFVVPETDTNFTVETITTAPQVVSVTGETNGTINVTFDRAVDTSTTNNIKTAFFGVNNNVNTGTVKSVSVKDNTDDKVIKVVAQNALNSGANVITIDNDFKDAWGNKLNADTDQRYSFTVTKDTTKPTVVSVVALDNQTLRVKFSEDVDTAYARNIANYELKDSSGVVKALSSTVTVASADDTFTLTSVNKLTGSNYTLKIKNIVDKASPANTMDEYIATVNGVDDVSPSVTQVVAVSGSSSKVAVYFDEKMDPATVTDPANFAYLDNKTTTETHSLPSSAAITLGDTGKYVTVEFPTGYSTTTTQSGSAADNSSYKVLGMRVSNVKDVAGNLLKDISQIGYIVPASAATAGKPKYSDNTFKLFADSNKAWAEFELDQTLSTLTISDFFIDATNGASAPAANTTATSGYISGKKVVLNFDTTAKRAQMMLLGQGAYLHTVAGTTSSNSSGVSLQQIGSINVWDDQIVPELVKIDGTHYVTVTDNLATYGGPAATTGVVLQFSEAVDGTISGLYNDDFAFTTTAGVALDVNRVVVSGQYVSYIFNTTVTLADEVVAKATSGKIDIKDIKDSGAKDQNLYVPKTDDINGRSSRN